MSSKEPKPLAKPWLATEMPYLQQYRQQTFEDGDPTGGKARYSELQKPYLYDENVPPEYMFWEFTWPPISFPTTPTTPDTPPSDCDVNEDCKFAKVIGGSVLKCGQCYTWSQFHYWVGCTIAPWWAAYGRWELQDAPDGVTMVSSGPVMATVCADETATNGTFKLCYYGPLGCTDCISVTLSDCSECCDASMEVTGSATVNPGATWTGTIDPACPGATCQVTSNSGCTLSCAVSEDGSQVTVTPGALDCGSFTVTVTDGGDGCEANTSSIEVRINNTGQGGSWVADGSGGCGTCGGCFQKPGFDSTVYDCTDGMHKYSFVGGSPSSVYCCANPPHPPNCCDGAAMCTDACVGVAPCGAFCFDGGGCGLPGTWTGECKMTWNITEWKCSC